MRALPGRGARRDGVPRRRGAARQLRGARDLLIARILIWSLFDSQTTLDELRQHLPELPDDAWWISNGVQDRLGLIAFGDDLPDLGRVPELIGEAPDVAEEFDVE